MTDLIDRAHARNLNDQHDPSGATATASTANATSTAVVVEQHDSHDRKWWITEARRIGSDWDSLLASHLAAIAAFRKRNDPNSGGVR
jgi:hypothetical protein